MTEPFAKQTPNRRGVFRSAVARRLTALALCGGMLCSGGIARRALAEDAPKTQPATAATQGEKKPAMKSVPVDSHEAVERAIAITKEFLFKAMKKDNWEVSPLADSEKQPFDV